MWGSYSDLVELNNPVSDVVAMHEECDRIILVQIAVVGRGEDSAVYGSQAFKVTVGSFYLLHGSVS